MSPGKREEPRLTERITKLTIFPTTLLGIRDPVKRLGDGESVEIAMNREGVAAPAPLTL